MGVSVTNGGGKGIYFSQSKLSVAHFLETYNEQVRINFCLPTCQRTVIIAEAILIARSWLELPHRIVKYDVSHRKKNIASFRAEESS